MVKKRIYLTKRQYKIAKFIYKKEPSIAQLMNKFKLDGQQAEQLLTEIEEIILPLHEDEKQNKESRVLLNERGLVAYEEKHERDSVRRLAWTALWITVGISAAALAVSIVAIALH